MTVAARIEPRSPDPLGVDVPHAEARLVVRGWSDWPAHVVRGAICTELERALTGRITDGWTALHVDWHGHSETGRSDRPARVCFRPRGRGVIEVYAWGDLAHTHVAALGRLGALRDPRGEVCAVEDVQARTATTALAITPKRWHGYELVTPYCPSDVTWGRRPRGRDGAWARPAWAGAALAASIRQVALTLGHDLEAGAHRVHVQIADFADARAEWARPDGREWRVDGFRARFVANVRLPDGIGLGRHRAEGFGEVRAC